MRSNNLRGHLGISGKFILVLISILLGFIVSEIGYRLYLYSKYVTARYRLSVITGKITPTVFLQPHTMFLPNETYEWLQFDEAGRLVQETRFHHNNAGWRSDFNYSQEKARGEFRIAVIGDSFVASHLSNVSWTDELAIHLAKDPALKSSVFATVSVYNFGVDGAAFEDYRQLYCMGAKPYSPDLIVLNFIPEALSRRNYALQDKTCDQIERATLETRASTDISGRTNGWVESVQGVKVHLTCIKPPPKLDNPACKLSRPCMSS